METSSITALRKLNGIHINRLRVWYMTWRASVTVCIQLYHSRLDTLWNYSQFTYVCEFTETRREGPFWNRWKIAALIRMSSVVSNVLLYTVFAYENKCLIIKCHVLLRTVSVTLVLLKLMQICIDFIKFLYGTLSHHI